MDSVAALAQQALVQVAGLLDTQDGNTYVFAGQDSENPPVPDPDSILSSGFYTQIAAQVGQLGTQGAAATAANTLAIAGSNAPGLSPFSAYLSQPAANIQAPTIQIGQGQTASVGLLASANSAVTSTGSSTTGSYMRDLMRALATIGSLSSSQVGDSGFQALVQDTNASLTGAISAMAEDVGVLGNTQTNLTASQTTMSDTATALTTQVGDVQDVDVAAAMSNLSLVQTQLAGLLPGDRRDERPVPGEIFARELMKILLQLHGLLTGLPQDGASPQKAGLSVTSVGKGKIPCPEL